MSKVGVAMPIAFQLAAANVPEREVAAQMLRRVELEGYTVVADKGFAGRDFEALMAELGAIFVRPDRKSEKPRFGNSAASARGSSRSSTPSRASSPSSSTARTPCPAS